MFDKEIASSDCRVCVLLCQLAYSEKKDTLLLLLGQLLDVAGVARYLLRHDKEQVGVVYPLGMNQPAEGEQERERETTLSTTPLCSLTSQAHLLMDQ